MSTQLRALFAFISLILVTSLSGVGTAYATKSSTAPIYYRVVFAVTVNDQHVWNEVFGNFHNIQR